MQITSDYEGGNIRLLRIRDNTVFLENDLRDTEGDWFYWNFCVKGAQGQTLTFTFCNHFCVSYWGAAVSTDRDSLALEQYRH